LDLRSHAKIRTGRGRRIATGAMELAAPGVGLSIANSGPQCYSSGMDSERPEPRISRHASIALIVGLALMWVAALFEFQGIQWKWVGLGFVTGAICVILSRPYLGPPPGRHRE
jgi:hypothetical protein